MKQKVYVISMSQWCKIGISNDTKRRLSEISTGCPLPPKIECEIEVENAPRSEKAIHSRLSSKHTNGEWFRIDPWEAVEICEEITGGLSDYAIAHRKFKALKKNWVPDPSKFTRQEAERIANSGSCKGFTKSYCIEKGIPYPQPKGWLKRLRVALLEHYSLWGG